LRYESVALACRSWEKEELAAMLDPERFDELAVASAKGTISRSRAIKLAGMALLGSGLALFLPAEDAVARRRRGCGRGDCSLCGAPGSDCLCVRKAGSRRTVCIAPSDIAACPRGQVDRDELNHILDLVCVAAGGCLQRTERVCVPRCAA
jgi:hypothetical protein